MFDCVPEDMPYASSMRDVCFHDSHSDTMKRFTLREAVRRAGLTQDVLDLSLIHI